jgi:hypothetical protein
MKSVFDPEGNKAVISRINSLKGNEKAQWGKMTVNQMVMHCTHPINVAIGNTTPKRTLIGILFGGMVKKKLVEAKEFDKNMPTDKSFIVKDSPDFNQAKTKLIGLVEGLAKNGHAGLTTAPHPFFGKLKHEEWDALMTKHLDHHLRQFGV